MAYRLGMDRKEYTSHHSSRRLLLLLDEELESAKKAIKTLGGQVERTADYQIPGTEVVHRVIFIKKIAETPKKYPRPFAKIKKNPL